MTATILFGNALHVGPFQRFGLVVLHAVGGGTLVFHFTVVQNAELVTKILGVGKQVRAIENGSLPGSLLSQQLLKTKPRPWVQPAEWFIQDD